MRPIPPPKPPSDRSKLRYGWFRKYEDYPAHPKWRRVARMSGQPIVVVKCVVDDLLCAASKARPMRGSLESVDLDDIAIANEIATEAVIAVYRTLQEIGWIDRQHVIVDWFDRQPDKEDATAAERQRNKRAKDRAIKNAQLGQASEADALLLSRVTPQPRQGGPLEPLELLPGTHPHAEAENERRARVWLFGQGRDDIGPAGRLTALMLGQAPASGATTVARWFGEIGHEAVTLAELISGVGRFAASADGFEKAIAQGIAAHVSLRDKGPPLPLPLSVQAGGRMKRPA